MTHYLAAGSLMDLIPISSFILNLCAVKAGDSICLFANYFVLKINEVSDNKWYHLPVHLDSFSSMGSWRFCSLDVWVKNTWWEKVFNPLPTSRVYAMALAHNCLDYELAQSSLLLLLNTIQDYRVMYQPNSSKNMITVCNKLLLLTNFENHKNKWSIIEQLNNKLLILTIHYHTISYMKTCTKITTQWTTKFTK